MVSAGRKQFDFYRSIELLGLHNWKYLQLIHIGKYLGMWRAAIRLP